MFPATTPKPLEYGMRVNGGTQSPSACPQGQTDKWKLTAEKKKR